jgi:hypothetical protein
VLVSANDGSSWQLIKSVPSNLGTTFSTGDEFSLAAFDSMAFFSANKNWGASGDCALLKYDVGSDTWSAENVNLGDGTGLGGRKFVKAFDLNRPDLADTLGSRLQLFYCASEDVIKAVGTNSDGTVMWNRFITAPESGFAGAKDNVHSDFWDLDFRSDGGIAWLACDGGVFEKVMPSGQWTTFNQNLYTHHISTLSAIETDLSLKQCFAYACPDNDGWYYDPVHGWNTPNYLGDGNWTSADVGNTNFALMVRSSCKAVITGFGNPVPYSGDTIVYGDVLSWSQNPGICPQPQPAHVYDGPLYLQFIQTLDNESPTYPQGDAVMLADLPLIYRNSSGQFASVPGPLGQPNPSGAPVLIRNTTFSASPHADSSQFQTWTLLANDLPTGTLGFWVSGGHANPVFYAYTSTGLYKRNLNGVGWTLLNVSGMLTGGLYGPAFVNPYDPSMVYVLTSSGVKVSTDGGATFQTDTSLTALLTASGKYPLTGAFNGGNGTYGYGNLVRGMGSRANLMGTLSAMAFNRQQPNQIVAASPYTGVFVNFGNGSWSYLTGYLPQPLASVSSVGFTGPLVYVATEGRGLLRVDLDDDNQCFLGGGALRVGPSDPYHRVKDAFSAAQAGCTTISIYTGTYHEAPDTFSGKSVRLESRGGQVIIGK